MRMSDLSAATGVAVATLKFYLREGVLHPGRSLSRTQAEYDQTHVQRVRLVRALAEVGGLDLATVRHVVDALDTPDVERIGVLAAAQHALLPPEQQDIDCDDTASDRPSRARDWATARGWFVGGDDPLIDQLDRAWQACDDAEIGVDAARLDRYADAVEAIAAVDVSTVPAEPAAAVRQVVLGTLLLDPVLATLRRLAQRQAAIAGDAAPTADLEKANA